MVRLFVVFMLTGIIFLSTHTIVYATPAQAYQDYLYQYDIYRQKYSDFRIAKSEFEKYKTLTSEKTALESSKSMLLQRNTLFSTYLSYINERLNSSIGLTDAEKRMYQSFIKNETDTLTSQNQSIPSLSSLNDISKASKEFDSRYLVIQKTLRQTMISLTLGSLVALNAQYETVLAQVKSFLSTREELYSPERRTTFDRWLIQSASKQDVYLQKYEEIVSLNNTMAAQSIQELDSAYTKIQTEVKQAHQYLREAITLLNEIVQTLPYTEG